MRAYDIIKKKRDGGVLCYEEIFFLIDGYLKGNIPDYQISAFLMAVYFKGMTDSETFALTDIMANSGEKADLSKIKGITADKHSTGGVGDKTTLIVAPLAAACGLKIAKMSGRGLGHTGGTIDKLESLKGFKTAFTKDEFINSVNNTGLCIAGQSGNLAPADKALYALRDVTATVESIPLIASSIMSKKLAAGADCIVLDVKLGSGAFSKNLPFAEKLADTMVKIGKVAGKKITALITDMDVPLGCTVGNSLEVMEAVKLLNGSGDERLKELCIELAAEMLMASSGSDYALCRKNAEEKLRSKDAFNYFAALVRNQGGDVGMLIEPDRLNNAPYKQEILCETEGFIYSMDTETIGVAAMLAGAGRTVKDSPVDLSAGIEIFYKTGSRVKKGDLLAVAYSSDKNKLAACAEKYRSALIFSDRQPPERPLIYKRIRSSEI